MARIVHVNSDGVVVRLTGWTALAALKREYPVDLDWALRRHGIPHRGHRDPVDGHPRRTLPSDGSWTFLSFDDRDRVLTVDLDPAPGAAYGVVAVGVDDPDTVAAEIDAWRAAS